MQHKFRIVLLFALLATLCTIPARAGRVALLLEQPYGKLGQVDPLGHIAVYLSDVCAETPVRLRRCEPGETGVVISRYHRIDGYDWLAMPLLPYLYSVNNPDAIPQTANRKLVMRLRDEYRRAYLMKYVPDAPEHEFPGGDWTQLLGEAYDRKIYGFELETQPEQDDALIAMLNDSTNRRRYNLAFNNCANFAEDILNFYYPHSVHRNFIVDIGTMTPKQTAHSLQKYAKRHRDLEFTTFVIPQVPGTIERSTPVHGVLEGLLETKKYALPLAIFHPEIVGGMLAIYFGEGRFHPGAKIETVFNPHDDREPGMMETAKSAPRTARQNSSTQADDERGAAETVSETADIEPGATRPSD